MATAIKTLKANGVLLRNCQIHDIVGQIHQVMSLVVMVCGHHCQTHHTAKFGEDTVKPRPSCYNLKISSTAVMTLNFDLDLTKVSSEFGTAAEYL